MPELTNDELIAKAASVLNPRKVGDFWMGEVGCALLTDQDQLYLEVCIDTGSRLRAADPLLPDERNADRHQGHAGFQEERISVRITEKHDTPRI